LLSDTSPPTPIPATTPSANSAGRTGPTIETIFVIIKSAISFWEFSLRGKEKVTGEWDLVCLSYNIKRLHGLKLGLAG